MNKSLADEFEDFRTRYTSLVQCLDATNMKFLQVVNEADTRFRDREKLAGVLEHGVQLALEYDALTDSYTRWSDGYVLELAQDERSLRHLQTLCWYALDRMECWTTAVTIGLTLGRRTDPREQGKS